MSQQFSASLSTVFDIHWNSFSIMIGPLILNLFDQENIHNLPRDLLDVCCGTGYLGKFFLESGFTVTGIDLSEEAIRLAKLKTNSSGSPALWIVGDASNFNTLQKYGIATSTFDSLNYLEDVKALTNCIGCISSHLLDNGLFVCDLFTAMGMRTLNSISIDEREDSLTIIRGFYNQNDAHAFLSFSGFIRNSTDSYTRFGQVLKLSVHKIEAVKNILEEHDFKDVRYYKISSKELIQIEDPESLERVVIMARKDKSRNSSLSQSAKP